MDQSLNWTHWLLRAADGATEVPQDIRQRVLPARVPGCVHTDLIRAGLIKHPNLGFSERDCQWIGESDWHYECRFVADARLVECERVALVCDGLDTLATITLNDTQLGTADNMFHAWRFDARPALRPGENRLEVVFKSPLRHTRAMTEQHGPRPANFDLCAYPYIRKMACNFGWDWGPHVATAGIWRSIRLHGWNTARLDVVRPLVIRERGGNWRVDIRAVLEHAGGEPGAEPVQLIAELADDACVVATGRVPLSTNAADADLALTVADPRLWWPRGYGEQSLYNLRVSLVKSDAGGAAQVLDSWAGRIGFRTVTLDTAPDESGSAFTIRINDRPIFCRGANWIPDALFPSELTSDDYRRRVTQAADANMNMLRGWGGGIYEDQSFYSACDEHGILVWQDFMFACATYPEEQPYWAQVEREARYNVARLCTHPSLALWCGGNECLWAYQSWGYKERLKPDQSWGGGYYFDLLARVVKELDPTRPYWPNSPYSGSRERDVLDPDHGNRHTWDRRVEGYRQFIPRFVSEFGHQAPANYATLCDAVEREELAPDSEAMAHRQRSSGNDQLLTQPVLEHFAAPGSFDDWHYLTQLMQARAVGLAVEWLRANSPRCMGVLYWQLNDCWTGHTWSAIDDAGRRKPLWYATRRAFAPRLLTIQPFDGAPALCAVNDTAEPWALHLDVSRRRFDGAILAEEQLDRVLAPHCASRVAQLADILGQPDDRCGELLVAVADDLCAHWFFEHDRRLRYPAPRLRTEITEAAGQIQLHLHAETLLRDVLLSVDRVHAGAEVDDNLVTLLPGESHVFSIRVPAAVDTDALRAPPVLQCANHFGAGQT